MVSNSIHTRHFVNEQVFFPRLWSRAARLQYSSHECWTGPMSSLQGEKNSEQIQSVGFLFNVHTSAIVKRKQLAFCYDCTKEEKVSHESEWHEMLSAAELYLWMWNFSVIEMAAHDIQFVIRVRWLLVQCGLRWKEMVHSSATRQQKVSFTSRRRHNRKIWLNTVVINVKIKRTNGLKMYLVGD